MWYFIPTIITSSLFPSIINAKKVNEELYYTRLQRLYTLMVWSSIGIALPMTFFSYWLVALLYGEAYSDAGQVLIISIWAGVFVALGVAQGKFWIANNLQSKVVIVTTVCSITNIILNYFFIPAYGVSGAAMATLISYAVGALIFPLLIKGAHEMAMLSYRAFLFRLN
jgi:O-antigen/teichoic acid export membrane protein